ncbi:MAG: hypothetical protein CGU28_13070 [Candidatus Dactylopiibacterium carminicum]|uniref:Polysaccharide biosynthesis protein n=1 Tax=Candidatus Dactylopiibacterium carminicum TaxID=857335 RepID=A0A272EPC9_9RHOO|nr:oligosaccharide flippase family protein [Candidatus Dactylopiibacterium carminicum]KAF7598260.1 hypothetical protein BGI27_14250 [Candidatus Dactylopiibacterium carminicum]PAS91941.1 MAG: hypothetical protein CGU29_13780 [Candidatus Dactylopiibacterium carminicum]PAS94997.1 MAG: hypothetical protein CGU28_13070 [Candidatus Dactylopiibacterium carminicum]PAS97143.1 MAG: hypothetical protein BSR46_14280 [Candidatus Dactylopiibacterium carminicum]
MNAKTTSQRVRQSMFSLLIGRPLSAVGGLLLLILLSRFLAPVEYGGYFAAWALIEIVVLASNCGLLHAVYRFVHASESLSGEIRPSGPVWRLFGWRVLSLALPALLLCLLSPSWLIERGLASALAACVPWLAAIMLAEGLARFIEAIFDSMLCQGRSQLTLTLRTLLRLGGVALLLMQGPLTLVGVLLVEVFATAAGALIGLGLLVQLWFKSAVASSATAAPDLRRMVRFSLPAYAAQVLGLGYGPDALKLVLAGVAGSAVLAVFGFAYSLAAVVQRYMPANLLAGVFRPVFVAAARREDAATVLPGLVGLCVKLNWLLILPLLAAAVLGGDRVLSLVSGGAYPQAGITLALILAGLLMVAVHQTLSLYCLAREDSWPPLFATAASLVALPAGIWLAKTWGAAGIALAFGLSELVWSVVCYGILRHRQGILRGIDFGGLARMLLAVLLALCPWLLRDWFALDGLLLGGLAGGLALLACWLLRPFCAQELQWLQTVFPVLGRFVFIKEGAKA